jgi:hypothetical protein
MTPKHYAELREAKRHLDWLFKRINEKGPLNIDVEDWLTAQWSWRCVRGALDYVPKPEPSEQCPGCNYLRSVGHICTKCGTRGNDRV